MSRGFWTRVQFPSVPPNKKRHIGRFFCFWWNRRAKQNPFPRPHFAFPIVAVMAEDKKAAALRLVLSACAQNGFFRECATTCSHLGALLFKFPSVCTSPPSHRTLAGSLFRRYAPYAFSLASSLRALLALGGFAFAKTVINCFLSSFWAFLSTNCSKSRKITLKTESERLKMLLQLYFYARKREKCWCAFCRSLLK